MESIDLSKYKVKEIIHEEDHEFDEITKYLLSIINDQSIPENQKHDVRKQFDYIMKMKQITIKPPTIILTTNE